MQSIIRNGDYFFTDEILLGDIIVPPKPHEYAKWTDGAWVIDADLFFAELDSQEAKEFLDSTDWQISRHLEQKELEIKPTMHEDDFLDLLRQRQEARDLILNEEE